MSVARMLAVAFLFSGAFCPRGAHAVVHAFNSAHSHAHDGGVVHSHDHEAEGHHDDSLFDSHDDPRVAGSSSETLSAAARENFFAPVLSEKNTTDTAFSGSMLDPPEVRLNSHRSPSSSGRAPPA